MPASFSNGTKNNMSIHEQDMFWVKRIEDLIRVLEGSTIGELELTEAGTEIIIRRRPDMMMTPIPNPQMGIVQPNIGSLSGSAAGLLAREERSVAIIAPLTGVYYGASSPTEPPFVSVGDVVQIGQVVALVEAMKVFNEIQAEVAGRVTTIVATNSNVVQKGDVLIRVEPA
jgi:acetyl-CoA carboxylase biotin carboxyl carrier protein